MGETILPTALMFFFVLAVGIIQIWLGFLGIEYLSNTIWAFLAVLALFFLRIILPLTVGTYFGAVEVMGWEPMIGLILAVPGFFFILPSILMSAIEPFLSQNKNSNSETNHNYTEPKNAPQIIEHEPLTKVKQTTIKKNADSLLQSSKFEKSKMVLEYIRRRNYMERKTELDTEIAEEFLISLENNQNRI